MEGTDPPKSRSPILSTARMAGATNVVHSESDLEFGPQGGQHGLVREQLLLVRKIYEDFRSCSDFRYGGFVLFSMLFMFSWI